MTAPRTMSDSARGLLSRDGFLRLLYHLGTGREPDGQERIAVYVVDVDNVEKMNAILGDTTGHQLLDLVIGRIHDLIPAESLVTRIRATTLGILAFGDPDEAVAEALCGALHEAIRRPMTVCGVEIHLCASIGVSLANGGVTPLQAMVFAERAVERVRVNGGDATFFHRDHILTNMEVAA
jgi:GGDEF domain-containing protein